MNRAHSTYSTVTRGKISITVRLIKLLLSFVLLKTIDFGMKNTFLKSFHTYFFERGKNSKIDCLNNSVNIKVKL